LALQTVVGSPSTEAAAVGTSQLSRPQEAARLGEPVPIVFARRRGQEGGVMISPRATEARFTNNQTTNAVTASYHLVLSEGQIAPIERRDLYQGQCRVGSYVQTFNRRAGTWDPGNFIVPVSGFDTPECPQYCGSVGTYKSISTLSYQITVPDGDDNWNLQVHAFIRNGMPVQRLYDNAYGPSDNFCDLVLWAIVNTYRVPADLIDVPAFTMSAAFLERYGLRCNGEFKDSNNVPDFIAQWSRYFLLRETNNNGKKGLRPVLPVTESGVLITDPIEPVYTFTDDVIMPNSFEANVTPLADRLPFAVHIMWRQHPDGHDIDTVRTAEVRFAGQAVNGPYESHDLSRVCTTELHAVRSGAYLVSRRLRCHHTARLTARPEIHNRILNQGDVVRVRIKRKTPNMQESFHDWLYQIERISKSLAGETVYELVHFPIDSEGRSLITQDVLAVQPTGIILPNNRTGPTCDLFGPDDQTLPDDVGREGVALSGSAMPGGGGGGGGYSADVPAVPSDGLDQPAAPLGIFPPGPVQPGSAVYMPENPCGEGNPPPVWRWLQGNERKGGQNRRYYVIGSADIRVGNAPPVRGEYRCGEEGWNAQVLDRPIDNLPPGREVQLYWEASLKRSGFIGPIGGWYPSEFYLYVADAGDGYDEIRLAGPNGNEPQRWIGVDGSVWVSKSRYRDNGGPWQSLYDYAEIL
jgi:hypothetical protein